MGTGHCGFENHHRRKKHAKKDVLLPDASSNSNIIPISQNRYDWGTQLSGCYAVEEKNIVIVTLKSIYILQTP